MSSLIQDWFRVWEDRPGIWVIEEPLHSEVVKSYLVIGSERAALIDTGMGVGDIRAVVEDITSLPIQVLLSHAHNDHIGGAHQFDEVAIHRSEADDLARGSSAQRLAHWFDPDEMSGPLPASFEPTGFRIPGVVATRSIADGEQFDLGGVELEAMHLPGHSQGGITFLDRAGRRLFSTDVVYLPQLYLLNQDSSVADYARSLARLVEIIGQIDLLYPAHGPSPIRANVIPDMHRAMVDIQNGREPDSVAFEPLIEGGRDDTSRRSRLLTYYFGTFEVLVAVV